MNDNPRGCRTHASPHRQRQHAARHVHQMHASTASKSSMSPRASVQPSTPPSSTRDSTSPPVSHLAAEAAEVLRVLTDLNLLDLLSETRAVAGPVLAHNPDLLRALRLRRCQGHRGGWPSAHPLITHDTACTINVHNSHPAHTSQASQHRRMSHPPALSRAARHDGRSPSRYMFHTQARSSRHAPS